MTTVEFREFVREREVWFRGRLPETENSLRSVETELGVRLPESLRWLLVEYGYWHGTSVSNLSDSVTHTRLAREHLELPQRYFVLENHDDGGLILIDTGEETSPGEFAIYGWIGAEDLGPDPNLPTSARLASFGAYVAHCLPSRQQFIHPDRVCYDPTGFPEGREMLGRDER